MGSSSIGDGVSGLIEGSGRGSNVLEAGSGSFESGDGDQYGAWLDSTGWPWTHRLISVVRLCMPRLLVVVAMVDCVLTRG